MSDAFERRLAVATGLGHARRLRECVVACDSLRAEASSDLRVLRLLAWAHFESGTFDPAIEASRAALALAPNDVDALRVLGRSLARTGRFDEAAEPLRLVAITAKSRGDDRGEDEARLARVCAQCEGHRDEARALVGRVAIGPNTSARAAHQWLRAAMSLAMLEQADAFARALLERAPDDPDFRASVASALQRLGRHEEARSHAIAAITLAPNHVLAWTVRSLACARLGLHEEREECESALRSARIAKREPRA